MFCRLSDRVEDTWEDIKDTAEDIGDFFDDVADDVSDWFDETADDVKDWFVSKTQGIGGFRGSQGMRHTPLTLLFLSCGFVEIIALSTIYCFIYK